MPLGIFYTSNTSDIRISARQASSFAKQVAGDFNPIHDPDNKRFRVPGNLLFALALAYQGVNRQMSFSFAGMLIPHQKQRRIDRQRF